MKIFLQSRYEKEMYWNVIEFQNSLTRINSSLENFDEI